MSNFTVTVPATTANLGPGFDCIGAALTLYNQVKFTFPSNQETQIIVTGLEADRVSTDKTNLLYQSFTKIYHHLGKPVPNVSIEIHLNIPLARGLGSSATAIVGGLIGANYLAGSPLTPSEIREIAITLEGHPDNVVPALLGNCQLSVGETGNWQVCPITWHQDIIPVVAIPNFELSTETARSVLPKELSYSDAIFNIARLGLLIKGLDTAQADWLSMAMEDKLHQPYRQSLIPGYEIVQQAAKAAGAYGMVISGAGPSLLALTHINHTAAVTTAIEKAWQTIGINADVLALAVDTKGATIEVSS
jgi:homoserine kinase